MRKHDQNVTLIDDNLNINPTMLLKLLYFLNAFITMNFRK